jgi:predicted ATP-dependent endonuclease of OLD family
MFRLKDIFFKKNKVFKTFGVGFQDLFDQNKAEPNRPYFSLIIGPNGTGKSYLLKFIVEIFRIAYAKKNALNYSGEITGRYKLEYEMNGALYTISNFIEIGGTDLEAVGGSNPVHFSKEVKTEEGIETIPNEIEFPERIIANSLMITDKFPVLKDDIFPIYTYLGIRRTSSVAGTRTYVRKTIELLTESIDEETFRSSLIDLLDFLGLQHSLYVSYIPKYKSKFFNGNLSKEFLNEFFENFTQHTRRDENRKPWGYDYFQKIKSDSVLLDRIATFCNEKSLELKPIYEKSRTLYFGYDVLSQQTLKEDYEMIKHLTKLDLISFPSITLRRQGNEYELEESSSGEYHFFSTIVGLLASIKNNSLILIDEPEVSLHPNWQMKYMEFLNLIFAKFNSSHFVITTHSHFLVSGLQSENSTIVAMSREKDGIIPRQMPQDTFGWSAEEVLYNIFKVKTVRNHFIEADLTDLLGLISENSKDRNRIQKLLSSIQSLSISTNDPLNVVIEEANSYLKTI